MAEATSVPLTLRVLTPDGVAAEIPCQSVHLTLADDERGRGGGDIGILRGHEPAFLLLGCGPARAFTDSRPVYSATVRGGFASVEKDIITVVTDSAEMKNNA